MLDVRPSSLSEMLSRLESQGDILRRRDEKDARISHIWLTEQGRQQIQRHNQTRLPISKCSFAVSDTAGDTGIESDLSEVN